MDPPPALVRGYSAHVLGAMLTDAARRGAFDGLSERGYDEVQATVEAIRRAGAAWQAWLERTSANGSAETAPAETAQAWSHDRVLEVEQVADMLGVSERRVRQLAPQLGSKASGRWTFREADVLAEVERRAA